MTKYPKKYIYKPNYATKKISDSNMFYSNNS